MAGDLNSSPTPFTPPTTEEDGLAWLRLIRSRRVGVATFYRLIAEYGSAGAALAALPEIARTSGVRDYQPCPEEVARAELRAGRAARARLLFNGAPDYPAALAALPDAPPLLWVMGQPEVLARPMVSLVGARNASSLGLRMTRKLAGELAEAGITVVSGLARGIDAAAHAAALAAGPDRGGTVGVHAGGVDIIYPAENTDLAQRIAEVGCRISEHPPGLEPQARHFPQRNRLVAGLAHAVIVVEAAERSGSLITASCAADQGREVLAVPGHPFDARAAGCNMLIRQGATLVRSVSDVMEAIAPLLARAAKRATPHDAPRGLPLGRARAEAPPPARPMAPLAEPAALDQMILDRLGPSPLAEDQLIRDLGLPAGRVAAELVMMELDGRVLRQPGGLLALGQPA
ncbi:DNA-processing protein DprA [Plastorhodobacter daqingensis]|uniref:DNA-processing protein DprA n=1 Tax=Plastorhodobacter daqingensis TaxID=1387281 RepID=A0ABW2UQ49_9RHOB